MVLGTLVGLPALRLSGLYLALITLMLAGAITVVLTTTNFPNGGRGLPRPHRVVDRQPGDAPAGHRHQRPRLLPLHGDRGRADVPARAAGTCARKPGRAWAAIRQSEPAALAAGREHHALQAVGVRARVVHDRRRGRRCWPAASASSTRYQFPTQDSIILLAVVLMGGIYSLWGAVVAGVLMKLLPALLDNWGLPADLLTILFGVGVLQVLLTAPAGLVDQFPKDMARLGRLLGGLSRRRRARRGDGAVIEIDDLTVRFGGVTPLDDMTVTLRDRHLRADRAERRRQDHLLQRAERLRAARPPARVRAFGEDLLAMPHFRRARWGLRRTFQTEQAIEELSVYDNVAMVHEHSRQGSRASRREDVLGRARRSSGSRSSPDKKVGTLGARERRLVEIARAVVGKPARRAARRAGGRACPTRRPSTSAA